MNRFPGNWLSNLTSIVRSKVSGPGAPQVINTQKPIPENIQFFTLPEVVKALNWDIELKDLDIPLIKQGCEIIKAPFIGGGVFWVQKTGDYAQEEDAAKRDIAKEIWKGTPAIVVFQRLEKNHPRYVYYQAIAIRSDDLIDLKKAMKIHKLKAFL